MEKQGRSAILFRRFKEHVKIGLDICAGTCYNIVRKCGHRTSASISAFQAEEVGSIPIARSIQKRRWFVQNQRRFSCFDITFYPTLAFDLQKSLFKIKKEKSRAAAFQQLPGSIFSRSQIGQKGKAPLLRWK